MKRSGKPRFRNENRYKFLHSLALYRHSVTSDLRLINVAEKAVIFYLSRRDIFEL